MSSNTRSNVTLNANEENITRIQHNFLRKTVKKISSKGTGHINSKIFYPKGLINVSTALNPNIFTSKNLGKIRQTHRNTRNLERISRGRRNVSLTDFLDRIVPIINYNDDADDEELHSLLNSLYKEQKTEYIKGLLTHAISKDNLYAAELLLKHGADPNEPDISGHVPLMKAVSPEGAKLLLEYGANVAYEIPNPNKSGQPMSLLKYFEYPDHRNAFVVPTTFEIHLNVVHGDGKLIKSIRNVIKGALPRNTRPSVAGGGGH